jgi:hypothetical protein
VPDPRPLPLREPEGSLIPDSAQSAFRLGYARAMLSRRC